MHRELKKVRGNGFALNQDRSERGVTALGRPVRDADGEAVAGLSISMPSVRYDPQKLGSWVAALGFAVRAIETDLGAASFENDDKRSRIEVLE